MDSVPAKRLRRDLLRTTLWGLRPWKRHGLVLLVAGLVFVGIGTSYILAEPTPARAKALYLALMWLPVETWGGIFMFAGFLSIISSRWPPVSKTWGYMVLTGLSAGWATFYLVDILFFDSPWTNISGTLSWGLVAFMWWAISGLRNPGEEQAIEAIVAQIVSERHQAEEAGR